MTVHESEIGDEESRKRYQEKVNIIHIIADKIERWVNDILIKAVNENKIFVTAKKTFCYDL